MAEKPNSAEFADQREIAMLHSQKKKKPGVRMVPEISSPRASKTLTETECTDPPASPDSVTAENNADVVETAIDYTATSDAIIEALRKIDGHITLNTAGKTEAAKILGCQSKSCAKSLVLSFLVGAIIGVGASKLMSKSKHHK